MKRGRVAQLVEPSAHNRTGGGSNPSPSTIKKDRLRKVAAELGIDMVTAIRWNKKNFNLHYWAARIMEGNL